MHVSDWLSSLPTTKLVAPAAVKIGRETYHGASYFDASANALSEPIFYLLGNVPPSYRRSRATAYRFPGETADWYLAAFADAAIANALPEFHPFGAWFQIRQWPNPGAIPIDAFDQRQYRRVTIELVG